MHIAVKYKKTQNKQLKNKLQAYYNTLTVMEAKSFRAYFEASIGKGRNTLWRWMNNKSQPSKLEKERLARWYREPVKNLFPEK